MVPWVPSFNALLGLHNLGAQTLPYLWVTLSLKVASHRTQWEIRMAKMQEKHMRTFQPQCGRACNTYSVLSPALFCAKIHTWCALTFGLPSTQIAKGRPGGLMAFCLPVRSLGLQLSHHICYFFDFNTYKKYPIW